MDKITFLHGIIVGIVITASFYPVISEAQEYFGKFPPTPAWQDIEIAVDANLPITDQTTINATSYNDRLFLISDGSININITEFTP